MGPNDYTLNVPDPSQAFMQGLQNGASIQDLQIKQQQQQVALSQQQTQQKALQEKGDKLKREAAVMSEVERTKAEREVRDGETNLSRRFNELQEDANLRRNEEFGKVQRALLQEVQAYARANGYQLIISDGVLFAAEMVDITPQVIAAVKAKAPAPAPAPAPKN